MAGLQWETAEEMNQKLARRVRNIRRRRKISQEALSEKSGVSYGTIKRFETTGMISLLSLTKTMSRNNYLHVCFRGGSVGALAMTPEHKAAFEYDNEWIKNGFPISPFSLPLEKKVFIASKQHFYGLFGVFADSLPDCVGKYSFKSSVKGTRNRSKYFNTIRTSGYYRK